MSRLGRADLLVAGKACLDAIEQSIDMWAEIAVEGVEKRVGPLGVEQRAEVRLELVRNLRSAHLDALDSVQSAISKTTEELD